MKQHQQCEIVDILVHSSCMSGKLLKQLKAQKTSDKKNEAKDEWWRDEQKKAVQEASSLHDVHHQWRHPHALECLIFHNMIRYLNSSLSAPISLSLCSMLSLFLSSSLSLSPFLSHPYFASTFGIHFIHKPLHTLGACVCAFLSFSSLYFSRRILKFLMNVKKKFSS